MRVSFSRRIAFWSKCIAGTTAITYGSFSVWTRHCRFEPFEPSNDGLFQHPFLKIINPLNNPNSHDKCVRRVPFSQLRPQLLQDVQHGGTALIESFAAGMWGGYGYGIQRRIMSYTKTKENEQDLWSKCELLNSAYEPGTYLTNHFHVLSKSPTSLVMRGCFDPRQHPPGPQAMDNIVELEVQIEKETKEVAFKMKTITFNGTESSSQDPDPFGGLVGWLHKQYVRLLLEAGVENCR